MISDLVSGWRKFMTQLILNQAFPPLALPLFLPEGERQKKPYEMFVFP